ncbi:MAG: SRPBCC domain-containing protein, partial [Emcibacteraceae bacterium]|nr:SRPBCC domain-containing protein [Emcibacteraceae bacterium]
MKDLIEIIEAVTRRVEKRDLDGKAACATILESVYETDATDLWDALTNKDRLPRWFAPVDGDFKLGGQFQIKGNAGGEITYCEAEKGFDLTWEYGSDVSWLKVRIKPENNKTHLYIEHLAHSEGEHFETYGPRATGVGWDLSMLGLGYYLQTTQSIDNDV